MDHTTNFQHTMTSRPASIFTLTIAIAIGLPASAQAQTAREDVASLWGVGHTTCTSALAFHEAGDPAKMNALVNWMQGYLSAKIEEQIASGAELFRLVSASVVEANLISFCSENRGKLVSDAAQAFSRRLVLK